MAMSAVVLGPLLAAAASGPNPVAIAASTPTWVAIAQQIINHIQTQATVVGVATGAMAGGPGVPVAATIT